MKEVMEVFGRLFLVATVAICVFSLVFFQIKDESGNEGIFAIAGAAIPAGEERSGAEYSVYSTVASTQAPTIEAVYVSSLTTGTYRLEEIVNAYDYAGNRAAAVISAVKPPNEADWIKTDRVTEVSFDAPGIYSLEIIAKDSNQKEIRRVIRVPVNGNV